MPTVLIIDDSEFDRRMIASAMKSACDDVKCVELSKGDKVLETMRSESPSLTILDIRMPGMSGWEVLEQIKSDKTLSGHNVVMMSGSHSSGDIKMAKTKGANGFYTKPHKQSDYRVVADEMKRTYINAAA
jgi:CheY-like chemotaxis protein